MILGQIEHALNRNHNQLSIDFMQQVLQFDRRKPCKSVE